MVDEINQVSASNEPNKKSIFRIREIGENQHLLFGVRLPPAVALAEERFQEPAEGGLYPGEGAAADLPKEQRLVSAANTATVGWQRVTAQTNTDNT